MDCEISTSERHPGRQELTKRFAYYIGLDSDKKTKLRAIKVIVARDTKAVITAFPIREHRVGKWIIIIIIALEDIELKLYFSVLSHHGAYCLQLS